MGNEQSQLICVLDKVFGFMFGIGLAFIIVNNPKLSIFTIPQTGLILTMISIPYLLFRSWKFKPPLAIFIPMMIILALVLFKAPAHFLLLNSSIWLNPTIFVLICLSVYVICKSHNNVLELPFALTTIFAAGGIVYTAFDTGLKSGGWVSVQNYDTVVPLLLIGCLICPVTWRYWIMGVSVTGLFFTGAEIGIVGAFGVVLVIIITRDFHKKLFIPLAALALCLLVATPTGLTYKLWINNEVQGTLGERIQATATAFNGGNLEDVDYLVSGNRITGNWNIRPITLNGYGLDIGTLTESTPHNQFLIMADQIGIIGAAAWAVATFAWAYRTRQWYLFSVLTAVGMLDHFFWTAGILWWWMLMGLNQTPKASPIAKAS